MKFNFKQKANKKQLTACIDQLSNSICEQKQCKNQMKGERNDKVPDRV